MIEVTQWFKCDKYRPVHVGWYEARFLATGFTKLPPTMRYWDGTIWRLTDNDEWTMFGDWGNGDQWRGLSNVQD